MRIALSNVRNSPSRATSKRLVAAIITCSALLITGCASHSSVGGLPSSNGDQLGRCPLGQAKVCNVGWPSRLNGGDRAKTCRCS